MGANIYGMAWVVSSFCQELPKMIKQLGQFLLVANPVSLSFILFSYFIFTLSLLVAGIHIIVTDLLGVWLELKSN